MRHLLPSVSYIIHRIPRQSDFYHRYFHNYHFSAMYVSISCLSPFEALFVTVHNFLVLRLELLNGLFDVIFIVILDKLFLCLIFYFVQVTNWEIWEIFLLFFKFIIPTVSYGLILSVSLLYLVIVFVKVSIELFSLFMYISTFQFHWGFELQYILPFHIH